MLRTPTRRLLAATALFAAATFGCGSDEPDTPRRATTSDAGQAASGTADTASDGGGDDLVARGERVYNVNCIACHHRDPRKDGGLGPPVAGASFELVEARVVRGEYPPGYTPKKDTRLMVPLRHLEPDIEALTAFLATFPPE